MNLCHCARFWNLHRQAITPVPKCSMAMLTKVSLSNSIKAKANFCEKYWRDLNNSRLSKILVMRLVGIFLTDKFAWYSNTILWPEYRTQNHMSVIHIRLAPNKFNVSLVHDSTSYCLPKFSVNHLKKYFDYKFFRARLYFEKKII